MRAGSSTMREQEQVHHHQTFRGFAREALPVSRRKRTRSSQPQAIRIFAWPTSGRGQVSRLASLPQLVILLLTAAVVGCLPLVRGAHSEQPEVHYYVTLPRVGHIRGARIDGALAQKAPPVVAFLGVPYAAPPVGLLRFMPPGAASAANQRALEQCQLMPGGHRAGVRPHTRFGRRCVHLSDWLDQPPNNDTHSYGAARALQSEDCLNLNAFVPIGAPEPSAAPNSAQQTKFSHSSPHQLHSPGVAQQQEPNQTNRSDNGTLANQANGSQSKSRAASPPDQPLVWPLPRPQPGDAPRLPVLVVVHGSAAAAAATTTMHANFQRGNKQNSFDYLDLARRTNSLVITFNYRLGLLGFMPYSMNEGSSSSNSAAAFTRNNHAIWDQIGLLHWLNRNIVHLNGDPRNVTLTAADNHANQYVQLLTMSPLSKGLFKRVVLVRDERQPQRGSHKQDIALLPARTSSLASLLAKVNEARDSRRRLSAALIRIVQQMAPEMAVDERKALEFVQAASLSQLAKVEQKLGQLGADNSFAIAMEPALDDRLLFPQLSALASHRATSVQSSIESLGAELKYCHYMRQLYATDKPDPLNLLTAGGGDGSNEWQQIEHPSIAAAAAATTGNWHRDVNASRPVTATRSSGSRATIVSNFDRLYKLQLLTRLLGLANDTAAAAATGAGRNGSLLVDPDEDEDDDEDGFEAISRRQHVRTVLAAHGAPTLKRRQTEVEASSTTSDQAQQRQQPGAAAALKRRSASVTTFASEELSQLMELIASFDLMVGYFTTTSDGFSDDNINVPVGNSLDVAAGSKSFTNISNALMRMWSSFSGQQLIQQLDMVELHHISSLLAPLDASANQYCDLFLHTTMASKSSYVFIAVVDQRNEQTADDDRKPQDSDWLVDFVDQIPSLANGLTNFVRFGVPNLRASVDGGANYASYWPAYDSLNRRLKRLSKISDSSVTSHSNSTPITTLQASNKIRNHLAVYLDLLPYLDRIRENGTTTVGDQYSGENIDIKACLEQIDEAIGAPPGDSSSSASQNLPKLFADPSGESKSSCLREMIAKSRAILRQSAVDDLEPIIKLRTTRLPHTNSSRPVIATRNLLATDSSDLQQLDQPSSSANMELSVSPRHTSLQQATNALNGAGNHAGILSGREPVAQGFFARLYSDAAGQALALVVGCGLLVFLVNLAIVVIITWRASSDRHRAASGADTNQRNEQTRAFASLSEAELTAAAGICGKRSSMKQRYDQMDQPVSSMLSSASKRPDHLSCTFKAKHLKFDLSGVESARRMENGMVEPQFEQTECDDSDQFGREDRVTVTSAHALVCHERQEAVMCSPESCADDLVAESGSGSHDCEAPLLASGGGGGGTTSVFADYQNRVTAGCDDVAYELQRMGNQQTFQELEAGKLADDIWPAAADSEHIYLKRQVNHHMLQQQQQQQHHQASERLRQHGGSLNSPAFGSQSTTTSTTNGGPNDHLNLHQHHHHLHHHHQLHQQQQQHYFMAQTSPDSSATLSVTPIRLESFSGAMPTISAIDQSQQFQLIEPIGLLYPASGFDQQHLDMVERSSGGEQVATDKVFMIAHQQHDGTQDQQQPSAFCPRHQRT